MGGLGVVELGVIDMKFFLLFAVLPLMVIASSFAGIVRYDNNYQGVRAGASTLEDVERLLGRPVEILKTPNGHNYRFEKVLINISGDSQGLVNTIIIDRDPSYKTDTGFKLGDILPEAPKKKGGSTWCDQEHGIIYWLADARIDRIVLMAKGTG